MAVSIYKKLGLGSVINAAGNMTYLGASSVDLEVAGAMAEASQAFVDMAALHQRAGQLLAEACGAEAGLVVSSAAAGIVTGVAAMVTCGHPGRAYALPRPQDDPRVLLLKAHAIDFGAPLTSLLAMTGAQVEEVGQVNAASIEVLAARVRAPGAAGCVYVVSHHIDALGSLPLAAVLEVCHDARVPVLVDAAAETDLKHYIAAGADLVVYSGHKALRGPTSGVLVGRRELIEEAAWHQTKGIGRAMKVGKEQIAGLLMALERYQAHPEAERRRLWSRRLEELADGLKYVCVTETAVLDERGIPRLALKGTGEWATALVMWLEKGQPAIRTRNHHVGQGIILLDPRNLTESDVPVIVERIKAFVDRSQ